MRNGILGMLLPVVLLLSTGALASGTEATYITCGEQVVISGEGAATDGEIIVISGAGRYVLRGVLPVGQVLVKARAAEVELVLDGFYAANPEGPALDVKNAESCVIELAAGSSNTLVSGSVDSFGAAAEGSGAALRAECDLVIQGEGVLDIYGCLNNGISCAGQLALAGGTLHIQAAKEGLKADSFRLCGAWAEVSALNDGVEEIGRAHV